MTPPPYSTRPRPRAAVTRGTSWTACLARVIAAAVVAVPLVAAWREPHVAVWLTAASIGLVLVSAVRPFTGVLLLCGLGPLAGWMTALAGAPWDGGGTTEILILSILAGALLRRVDPGDRRPVAFTRAALVFGVVVGASAAVALGVQQLGADWWWGFLQGLADYTVRAYFVDVDFPALHPAMMLIEGALLAALIARLTTERPERAAALLRVLVIGATAAAICSWYRLAQISVRSGHALTAAEYFVRTQRISPLYGDINAAGSGFALLLVPAVLMWIARPRRLAWAAAALVIGGALALTSSRAAELCAAAAMVAGAWFLLRDRSHRVRIGLGATALLLGSLVAVAVSGVGRDAHAPVDEAMQVRVALARVALQITASHPLTGVGIGGFADASQPYITPALVRLFPPAAHGENAHDNYLQLLAELGVVGLASFLWLLVTAIRPSIRARAAPDMPPERVAVVGGVGAFLATCVFGHPLLTPEVAWVFFACLGLCAGLATSGRPATPSWRWPRWALGALILGLAASVPARTVQARRAAIRDHFVVGATDVLGVLDDVPYRRANAHSAWFVDAHARLVELPLRLGARAATPCQVAIAVDGRPADAVTPSAAAWTTVRMELPAPPADLATRRIDLRVSPEPCDLLVGRVIER